MHNQFYLYELTRDTRLGGSKGTGIIAAKGTSFVYGQYVVEVSTRKKGRVKETGKRYRIVYETDEVTQVATETFLGLVNRVTESPWGTGLAVTNVIGRKAEEGMMYYFRNVITTDGMDGLGEEDIGMRGRKA